MVVDRRRGEPGPRQVRRDDQVPRVGLWQMDTGARRSLLAFVFLIFGVGLLLSQLVSIQVLDASELAAAGQQSRSLPKTVQGVRGSIVDRNGQALALAEQRFDVTVSPRQVSDFTRSGKDGAKITVTVDQAAAEIGAVLGMTAAQVREPIDTALAEDPKSDFGYIKRNVDLMAYRALDDMDVPWLFFEAVQARTYPLGAIAGNVVGFLGSDGEPLAGVELNNDDCLASQDGQVSYERGGDGVEIPGSARTTTEAVNGSDLVLTIDADLQWSVQEILARESQAQGADYGMAVVEDVKTGELVAVADWPTVDPNNVDASSAEARGSRAFSSPYEPGSTMKMLTAASLVDAGAADPLTQVNAPYEITFPNGASFHDWGHHEENLTLTGALVLSSNTGIAQLGDRLSAKDRWDYMKKFGLGDPTAVGFLGESGGLLADWDAWDNQTYYTTTFGQGLALTAVQLADAYAAFGNGGVRMPASLVAGCKGPDGKLVTPKAAEPVRVISEQASSTVLQLMENVKEQGDYSGRLGVPGYRIGVKTGTAQQSNGDGAYSDQFTVSMAAVFPIDAPRYSVVVVMHSPDSQASAATVDAMHKIIQRVIAIEGVLPSTGGPDLLPITY